LNIIFLGKILPKLRRRSITITDPAAGNTGDACKLHDYVFRIVPSCAPALTISERNNNLDMTIAHEIAAIKDSICELRLFSVRLF
uniref:Kinesin motor domain-containing protein n=1 Tax=Gongylonema pulchrum TaxID=637853 RepID=A0A183DM27_9BILA